MSKRSGHVAMEHNFSLHAIQKIELKNDTRSKTSASKKRKA